MMKRTTLIILAIAVVLALPRILIHILDLDPSEPTAKAKSKEKKVVLENQQTPSIAIRDAEVSNHFFSLESFSGQEFIGDLNTEDGLDQTEDTIDQTTAISKYIINTHGLKIGSKAPQPITEQDRQKRQRQVKEYFTGLRELPLDIEQGDFYSYAEDSAN